MGLNPESIIVTEEKLASLGTFQSNNAGVAIVRQRKPALASQVLERAQKEFILVLDDVRDPGNLGTIIRTADWFGITHIVTSETTTDFYNPKTISASMGSFTRVSVTPLPLVQFFSEAEQMNIPSFGAFLDGKSLYEYLQPNHGLIVMGSESHGINKELESLITERITIPRYGKAESLNVSVATGIILSAFRQ
jgi:TrmH family RNA methyltransferase